MTASFHRMILPYLYPELNKIFFLSANVIVNDDLYNIDLGENYIAVTEEIIKSNYQKTLIKTMFNAKIMLLNCKN